MNFLKGMGGRAWNWLIHLFDQHLWRDLYESGVMMALWIPQLKKKNSFLSLTHCMFLEGRLIYYPYKEHIPLSINVMYSTLVLHNLFVHV